MSPVSEHVYSFSPAFASRKQTYQAKINISDHTHSTRPRSLSQEKATTCGPEHKQLKS